jgi:putative peptidoglycan lipid II flippase
LRHPQTSISEAQSVSHAAGTVGFFTFLSRILGLVRDIVVAGYFGAGMAADAFFVAFRIPNLLRRLFAEGSLTIAFIPVFTEYLTKKSKEDAFELARAVMTLLSIALAVVTILGIVFAPWVVRIQAFGFGGSGVKYDLTVLLTRITFPYIFLISLVAFFMGILNSLRHFAAPAAAPIFLNVGIIASTVWIAPHCAQPVMGVAIGVIIGGVMQLALQIPWVLRKGVSLFPCWRPGHPAVKRIGLLMLPAIFGSAIYQLNQFVGTLLASFLPEGSVSWLYYADRLVEFPLGVFAIAISTAALPSLSKQAAGLEMDEFKDTLSHALRLVFFITIPSMAGLIALREPLIQLFFERGAFGPFSTDMTALALFYYTVGLWAFSGIRVMVSAFYALQDTKTPVKVAAVAMMAHLVFSLILMGPLKHGGLALSLSVASSLHFCLLVFLLHRRLGLQSLRSVGITGLKSLLASTVMGLAIYAMHALWSAGVGAQGLLFLAAQVAALVFTGAVLYFGMTRLMGCGEVSIMMDILRPVLKRRGFR